MIFASVHFVLSHLPNFNSISGVSLAAAVMSPSDLLEFSAQILGKLGSRGDPIPNKRALHLTLFGNLFGHPGPASPYLVLCPNFLEFWVGNFWGSRSAKKFHQKEGYFEQKIIMFALMVVLCNGADMDFTINATK
ncbi:hypothetical protein FH972_002413 [Carpinus fangiana]|uniref:Uncharacterized protein n=1 Tax=Carpinus fangiana TaxID=176857 RepID=A0A5N6QH43_9ROSI|nr:hypothetical protein FH972_002413 [Carpinus fangiana]